MEKETVTFRESSGNVFADLGLEAADDLLAKAELALAVRSRIKQMGLNQTQAADLMGTTQARVSELYNAKVMNMTYDRLFGFLLALDCDAHINVTERAGKKQAKVIVSAPSASESKAAEAAHDFSYTTQDGATVSIQIKNGQTWWTEKLSPDSPPQTYVLERDKVLEVMQMFKERAQDFLDSAPLKMIFGDAHSHATLSAWDCGYIAALLKVAV